MQYKSSTSKNPKLVCSIPRTAKVYVTEYPATPTRSRGMESVGALLR